jgi:hypothetical protein
MTQPVQHVELNYGMNFQRHNKLLKTKRNATITLVRNEP